MGEHIWLVRNPEGRVIGASVTPAGAVRDVKSHCGATTGAAMNELSQVVYADRSAGSYKWAGYTITREPLPTGTAGVVVTDEMVWPSEQSVRELHDAAMEAFDTGAFEEAAVYEAAALARAIKLNVSVRTRCILAKSLGGIAQRIQDDASSKAALAASTRTGEGE